MRGPGVRAAGLRLRGVYAPTHTLVIRFLRQGQLKAPTARTSFADRALLQVKEAGSALRIEQIAEVVQHVGDLMEVLRKCRDGD